jgi:hypothetical protein
MIEHLTKVLDLIGVNSRVVVREDADLPAPTSCDDFGAERVGDLLVLPFARLSRSSGTVYARVARCRTSPAARTPSSAVCMKSIAPRRSRRRAHRRS